MLEDDKLVKKRIIKELKEVSKKYGYERQTKIITEDKSKAIETTDLIPDFEAKIFLSKDGYIKKIPLKSYRMVNTQKLKEDDEVLCELDGNNKSQLLFFTDAQNLYTINAYDLPEQKASNLGDYLPNILKIEDEKIIYMIVNDEYRGFMLFGFENGKVAKVPLSSYKSNRKKLVKAFFADEPLIYIQHHNEEEDILLLRDDDKCAIVNTALIPEKVTKNTRGVQVFKLKKNSKCYKIINKTYLESFELSLYESNKIPASGHFITDMTLKNKLKDLIEK